VCYRDATASSLKVRGKVFANFHQSPCNVTVVCGIECLACQGEFFVNNPLDMLIKVMSMLLTLHFTRLAFFDLGEFGLDDGV
jgi:hypothetical protein